MKPTLSGSHRATYDAIFRHPAAHNLDWRDVRSLLHVLGDLVEETNGNLKVTRGGETLVLHPSREKDVGEVEQLMAIRHFLERSGAAGPEENAAGTHLLVTLDHREAQVYRTEMHGAVPQRITPYDPHGSGRYLHYVGDDSNGQRVPERKSFYEAIAKTLREAKTILLFGSGTGASSAMEELMRELKRNHKELAARVLASVVVDQTHLSENQLLAHARDFYAKDARFKPSE